MTTTSTDASCDVAVVGGGPSGAAAAITLARLGLNVVIVEGTHYTAQRLGETVAPAARPVLARLDSGILQLDDLHVPSYGNESAWGSDLLESATFVFGPHGDGLHVDRGAFDAHLAKTAEDTGVKTLLGIRVRACEHASNASWRLALSDAPHALETAAIVDASGRRAVIARSLGAHRQLRDRLVGVATFYNDVSGGGGPTTVEAAADGWWYSAPLPDRRAVVVFMTDADLCRDGKYADVSRWERAVGRTHYIRECVAGGRRSTKPRVASAASYRLDRRADSRRWLAAGDAAMAVDPLSGGGILRALLSGEAAATAMAHWLVGRTGPAEAYERWLDRRFNDEWAERARQYSLETRFQEEPFWRRRHEAPTPVRSH